MRAISFMVAPEDVTFAAEDNVIIGTVALYGATGGDLFANGLGGVVLFAWNVRDAEQVASLAAALRTERPELLVSTDEEGGDVTRLEAARGSSYPGNLALGVVDDVSLTETVAAAIGSDLAAAGINLDLAPVADVNTNPRNPVIGTRSFGDDPGSVARFCASWVIGSEGAGVATSPKHFPGHGATAHDTHHTTVDVLVERSVLEARELVPFRAAFAAGASSVMTAHVRYPAFDDDSIA